MRRLYTYKGIVDQPNMWIFSGYNEIQDPPNRYRIIDLDSLVRLMGFTDLRSFQAAHKGWVEATLQVGEFKRESHFTESIAVGSQSFMGKVKNSLGFKAIGRSITGSKKHYQLRESVTKFGNSPPDEVNAVAGPDSEFTNTFVWDEKS